MGGSRLRSASQASDLGPPDLVALWERAASGRPREAAAEALIAAGCELSPGSTIGERDAVLLSLRRRQLGDAIELVATCPSCLATVEATVSCTSLLSSGQAGASEWSVRVGPYDLRVRGLRPEDEAAAAAASSVDAARSVLLGRALISASRRGRSVSPDALPLTVIAEVGRSIVERDPLAEIVIAFGCPDCGSRWTEVFDTARLVVEDLARLGRDLLEDVDVLARVYGWSEAAIFALPPGRRATYVALASG